MTHGETTAAAMTSTLHQQNVDAKEAAAAATAKAATLSSLVKKLRTRVVGDSAAFHQREVAVGGLECFCTVHLISLHSVNASLAINMRLCAFHP
jgi:hypothetical protein